MPGAVFKRAKANVGKLVWWSGEDNHSCATFALLVEAQIRTYTSSDTHEYLSVLRYMRPGTQASLRLVRSVSDDLGDKFRAYYIKLLIGEMILERVYPITYDPFFEGDVIL